MHAFRAVGVLVILSSIVPIALLLGSISATEPDQNEISAKQIEFVEPLPISVGEAVEKSGDQVIPQLVNASEPREEVELEEPVAEISEEDFLSLEGHVLEWAFITVFRELTISQKEYIVRAELAESDFSIAPWLKDFLDDVNAKTSQWEETCIRDNRIDFRICTPLSGSRFTLDEVRLNSVLELVNPEPPDFRKGLPQGEVQIYYESIIYLDGRTYVIIVGTKWVVEDPDNSPLADIPLLSIVEKHRALEGIPVDFVFQGGFISVVRANREMGKDAVREDINDVVLQSSSILHPMLEQLRITWEARQCDRPDRCEFGSLAFPRIDRDISENELDTILTLLNPIFEEPDFKGPNNLQQDNGVWVVYKGDRYLISIHTGWAPGRILDPVLDPVVPVVPNLPYIILWDAMGLRYSGLLGSGCWPVIEAGEVVDLCFDSEFGVPSFSVNATAGDILTLELQAHEAPSLLKAIVYLYENGTAVQVDVLLIGSDLTFQAPSTPGVYIIHIHGEWDEGEVYFAFKIKVEANPD